MTTAQINLNVMSPFLILCINSKFPISPKENQYWKGLKCELVPKVENVFL